MEVFILTMAHAEVNVRIPLALNFSGGISLGAYMAGVFYELTREALQQDSKLVVDIITGASAGAISSVLAAYYLLGAEPFPSSPQESIFYKAWVEKVDISKLLPAGVEPEPDSVSGQQNWSLLSGKFIEDIAQELIGSLRDKIEQAGREPMLLSPIALLVTLTNLQGLLKKTNFPVNAERAADTTVCEASTASGQKDYIETISSAETRQFLFHSGLPLDTLGGMWQKAERSARASGAFPVAFPPIGDDSNVNSPNLVSLSDDYLDSSSSVGERALRKDESGQVVEELRNICRSPDDDRTLRFQYTDGGILDGLPIVKAIALESALLKAAKLLEDKQQGNISEEEYSKRYEELAKNYPLLKDRNFDAFLEHWTALGVKSQSEERLYVYIQPTPANTLNSRSSLKKGKFSMLEVGLSGLTLPKSEHDAIRLEEIRLRNEDARRKQAFLDRLNGSEFQSLSDDMKRTLVESVEEAVPYRTIQLCRIDPSLVARAYGEEGQQRFPSIYQALENALPKYMKDAIEGEDEKSLLASDFLGAFGGFFDRTYRDHDFLLGQICGQLWLIENVWKVEQDEDPHVRELVNSIDNNKARFLKDDPKPSNLDEPSIKQLERLVWRAFVLLFKEFNSKKIEISEEEKEFQSLIKKVLGRIVVKRLLVPIGIIFAVAIAIYLALD